MNNTHNDSSPSITVNVRDGQNSKNLTIYDTDLETVLNDIRSDQSEIKRRTLMIDRRVVTPPTIETEALGQHIDTHA